MENKNILCSVSQFNFFSNPNLFIHSHDKFIFNLFLLFDELSNRDHSLQLKINVLFAIEFIIFAKIKKDSKKNKYYEHVANRITVVG